MAVDERARHEPYLSMEEMIGQEKADTLMSMLPPVGWADVATKQDLLSLESRIRGELHEGLNNQLRSIIFATVGMVITIASLNLTVIALLR